MFTGIIEEVGSIIAIQKNNQLATLNQTNKVSHQGFSMQIRAKKVLEESKIGDSISVNGVCLTLTNIGIDFFTADVSEETLKKTAFLSYRSGTLVNLERAARLSTRIGGHLVQGHVDTTTKIESIQKTYNSNIFRIACPKHLRKYLAEKGSVALDGVSLTLYQLDSTSFSVSLIPLTLTSTTFKNKKAGEAIHLECDSIAKHIESILLYGDRNGKN